MRRETHNVELHNKTIKKQPKLPLVHIKRKWSNIVLPLHYSYKTQANSSSKQNTISEHKGHGCILHEQLCTYGTPQGIKHYHRDLGCNVPIASR